MYKTSKVVSALSIIIAVLPMLIVCQRVSAKIIATTVNIAGNLTSATMVNLPNGLTAYACVLGMNTSQNQVLAMSPGGGAQAPVMEIRRNTPKAIKSTVSNMTGGSVSLSRLDPGMVMASGSLTTIGVMFVTEGESITLADAQNYYNNGGNNLVLGGYDVDNTMNIDDAIAQAVIDKSGGVQIESVSDTDDSDFE